MAYDRRGDDTRWVREVKLRPYNPCRSQLQMSGFWLLTDVAVGTLLMPLVMDSSAVFLLLFSSVRQWPSTQ